MFELNPTGEMYSPSWTMNGTIYRKSRYLTFSAAIQRPGPRFATNASTMKSGNKVICQPGTKRYQHIKITTIAKLIRKSTKFTAIDAAGTISLGKYTFVIRLASLTRLLPASYQLAENKLHRIIPTNTVSGYGTLPSDGSLANRPNMMVKTSIVRNGRTNAHNTPKTVSL